MTKQKTKKIDGILHFGSTIVEYSFIQTQNDVATIVATGGANGGYMNGPGNIYHNLETYLPKIRMSFLRINVTNNYENGANQVYQTINHFLISKNYKKSLIMMGWSMGGSSVLNAVRLLQKQIRVDEIIVFGCQPTNIEVVRNIPCRINFVHGTQDQIFNYNESLNMYNTNANKNSIFLLNTDHFMNNNSLELINIIENLLIKYID
jgi:alpha/beta superfamily hydrolase